VQGMQGDGSTDRRVKRKQIGAIMKKAILFQVEEEQHKKLAEFAADHQKTISAALREMIAFFIPEFAMEIHPMGTKNRSLFPPKRSRSFLFHTIHYNAP
jgi:hypothetical protein